MAAPQNFRSALNGFNREDVVHYLEYINTKYQNQIDQLIAENQELQNAAQRRPLVDQDDLREYLQAQPSFEEKGNCVRSRQIHQRSDPFFPVL